MYLNTPDLKTARRFYLDALANESCVMLERAEQRDDARGIAKWEAINAKRMARLVHFHNRDRPRFPGE